MDSAGGESRLPGHRSNPLACVPHAFWLGTVLRVQAYRFVLRPDGAQERLLRRYVFNRALALQKERYAAGGKHLSYADLCRHLTACKAEPDTSWLKEVHSQVLQQALKDLDRAYRNFFEGRAEFPKFKRSSSTSRTGASACPSSAGCAAAPPAPSRARSGRSPSR
jgi:Helix-turn-helix domain